MATTKKNRSKSTLKKPVRKKPVRTFRSYEDALIESLQNNPGEDIAYLNAALMDDDPRVFLLALRHVIQARYGSMGTIAKETDLNRENLYRMLSKDGNPELYNVFKLLNALGLHISVADTATKPAH